MFSSIEPILPFSMVRVMRYSDPLGTGLFLELEGIVRQKSSRAWALHIPELSALWCLFLHAPVSGNSRSSSHTAMMLNRCSCCGHLLSFFLQSRGRAEGQSSLFCSTDRHSVEVRFSRVIGFSPEALRMHSGIAPTSSSEATRVSHFGGLKGASSSVQALLMVQLWYRL